MKKILLILLLAFNLFSLATYAQEGTYTRNALSIDFLVRNPCVGQNDGTITITLTSSSDGATANLFVFDDVGNFLASSPLALGVPFVYNATNPAANAPYNLLVFDPASNTINTLTVDFDALDMQQISAPSINIISQQDNTSCNAGSIDGEIIVDITGGSSGLAGGNNFTYTITSTSGLPGFPVGPNTFDGTGNLDFAALSGNSALRGGDYTIEVTDNYTTCVTQSRLITIDDPSPTVFDITSDLNPIICDGEDITIEINGSQNDAFGQVTYTVLENGTSTGIQVLGDGSTSTSFLVPAAELEDGATYTIEATNGFCTPVLMNGAVNVTINPLPDATINPPGPFCTNDGSVNLSAATAGGTWSGTGITDAALGTFDPAIAGVGTFIITYTITDGNGCTGVDTENIVVNDLPDATIDAAGPFCENDGPVNLSSATPGGTWSGVGITDTANGIFDPSVAGAGTYTITYTVTDGNGCTNVDTEDITVNALPDVTITPAGPFCENDAPINLTAATPGGTWSGTGITDPALGTFDPSIAGAGTFTITYELTDGNGCTNVDTEDIIVNALPDVTITPAGPFCINDAPINLTAATPGGTWSGTGITDPALGTFDPSTAGVGTFTITYEFTDGNGCTNIDTEDITVNTLPDATITPAGPFCEDDAPVNLTAVDPGGTWTGIGITDATLGTFDPATAGVGTHTISYTINDPVCGVISDTEDITVNALPDATIAPAGPFCEDDVAVNLTATTPGGTWSGNGITDAALGTFDPATAGVGVHTITYTVTDGNGCTNNDTEDIVVNALPDATITPAGPFCENDVAVNLSAATAGGTWSGNGITDAALGTFDPATAGIGIHTITYTVMDGNGCTSVDTEDITVNALPDVTITPAGPFCENDVAVNLSAATAGGTWSGNGITDTALGTFDPATAGVGVHTITYTVTDGNGCTNVDTEDIVVNALPDATIAPAGPFCENDVAVNLSAATAGGTWSGNGITDTALGTFDPATAGIGTHTITYTVTDGNGCTSVDTEDITVNALPDATITPAGPFCEDDAAVNLTAATPGGSWSGAGITDAVNGTFDPAVAGAGIHTITYTLIDPVCGNVIDTEDITVNPLPDATIAVGGPFCENDVAVNLTAATPGGTWSGTGITDANLGTFDPSVAGVGTFTITYTVTDGNGCSNVDTEDIVVNALPDATIVPAGPFCENDTPINFTAATPGGTWSGTGITDANLGTFDPSVAGAGVFTITYTVIDGNGCTGIDTEDVTVNPLPDVTIASAGPFCINEAPVNLSAATPGGTWSGPGITDAALGTFNPANAGIGTHTITYTFTDLNGCTNVDTEDIVVNPLPDATITPAAFCANDAASNLTAATPGGTWSGTGITDSANGTFDPTVAGVGTFTVVYTINDPVCGIISDTEDIVVNALPDATITAAGPFCENDGAINLVAATPGGTWSGTGITDAANGTFDPTVAGAGTHTITYSITDVNGCTGLDTEDILVNSLPDVTISAAGPFCENDAAVNLTAATPGGTWSGTGITDAAVGTFDPVVAGAGTHTVTYTFTDANGCTGIDTEDLIVNPIPDATISSAGPFCAGDAAVNLTAATGGGTWSGNGILDPNTGLFDPTVAGVGNHTITYSITDGNGCTAIDTEDIVVNDSPVITFNVTDPSSCGANDGEIDAVISGGTAPYTFSWNNGATTEDISGLAAGLYTLTVTDATGCSAVLSTTVNDPATFTLSGTTTDVTTCGASDGSIDLTVTGGTAPFTFNWNNGATTEDISGLAAGNYSVGVTDASGCLVTSFFTISEPPSILLSSSVSNTSSCGTNDGAIDINVVGGTAPFTFSWSSGESTEDISGLTAGDYTVTVTDVNGCSEILTVTVGPPTFTVSGTITDISTCGASDGAIDITIAGGTAPFTFSWDNSETTEDISGLSSGTYTVEVTDANGCVVIESFILNEPPALTFTSVIADPTTCAGNDGSIDISITGGTAPYTFLWGGGETSEDLTGLSAGTYSLTITDANNCTATGNFTLSDPATFSLGFVVADVSTCGGNDGAVDLTITGGVAPFTYLWSNGETTEDISGLTAGSYTVEVIDASGCSVIQTAIVNEPPSFTLSTTVTDASSCGVSDGAIDLLVTGGTAPFNYAWSSGETTEDISSLSAGLYSVTVTDANGCSESLNNIVVSEPASFTLATAVTDVSACLAGDGEIDLTITGGTAPFTVLWSNGATTEDLTSISGGSYTVEVTDANGCTVFASAFVDEDPAITISAVTTDPTTCSGSNGSIDITVTGGTAPFTYLWNTSATTEDLTGLPAGIYEVVITDAAGCNEIATYTLVDPVTYTVTENITDVSTCGGNDGAIDLDITGGTLPFTFTWSNGETTEDISGLLSGNYQVTIVDGSGCTSIQTYTVAEPPAIALTSTVTNASACGVADGAIDLTVTGGTAPFTFSWSNSASTEDISGLGGGNYTVTVTDAAGCTEVLSVAVTEPTGFTLSTNITDATTCGGTDGAIDLVVTGGTAPYTYLWSNGETTEDITGLSEGIYSVTVTDATGCSNNISATVANPPSCGVDCSLFSVNFENVLPNCGQDNGIVRLNSLTYNGNPITDYQITLFYIESGTPSIDIQVPNPAGNEIANRREGSYEYEILDFTTGLVCSGAFDLPFETTVQADTVAGTKQDIVCFGDANGSMQIDVADSQTGEYYYSVDGGSNWILLPGSRRVEGLAAGFNAVLIGEQPDDICPAEVFINVETLFPQIDISTSVSAASCDNNDGSITVNSVTGGSGLFDFRFQGAFFEDLPAGGVFENLDGGNFILTVIDEQNGCEQDFDILVPFPGLVQFETTVNNPDCSDPAAGNGSIDIAILQAGIFEVGISSESTSDPAEFFEVISEGNSSVVYSFEDLDQGNYFITVVSSGSVCPNRRLVTIDGGPEPISFELAQICENNDLALEFSSITGERTTPLLIEFYRQGRVNPEFTETVDGIPAGNILIVEDIRSRLGTGNYEVRVLQEQTSCPAGQVIASELQSFIIRAPLQAEISETEISQPYPEEPNGSITVTNITGGFPEYVIAADLDSAANPLQDFSTDFDSVRLNNNLIYEYTFENIPAGRYTIEVMDTTGCSIQLIARVGVNTSLFIPNVFTPNGDGSNDTFFIRNLSAAQDNGARLVVANRWGKVIYESDNYQNDWDGGEAIEGVYYYTLETNGEVINGWLQIIRGRSE